MNPVRAPEAGSPPHPDPPLANQRFTAVVAPPSAGRTSVERRLPDSVAVARRERADSTAVRPPVGRRLPDSVAVTGVNGPIPRMPDGLLGGGYPVQWRLPARTGQFHGCQAPVGRLLPDSEAFSHVRWRLNRHLTTPIATQSGNRHADGESPMHRGQDHPGGGQARRPGRARPRTRGGTAHEQRRRPAPIAGVTADRGGG